MLFFCPAALFAQKGQLSDYYWLRSKYESRSENDSSALTIVGKYIAKAKTEKNYQRLFEGYKDGIFYSAVPEQKLRYADSLISAAERKGDQDLISRAYLAKGVVYYFNFKKYKLALDEYLKAYQYLSNAADGYHRYRLLYLIAVVKSYIGYYDESLMIFKQTAAYFEGMSKKNIHPVLIHDNLRGYYNSLHQMAVGYRNMANFKMADSITRIGLKLTADDKNFEQEYGYFLKEKGISSFYRKDYQQAITSLQRSLNSISTVNDFAWATVCYSYIGKSYLSLGDETREKLYFQKVDSVFQKHNFILPELRNNYEELIDQYKREGNFRKQLYFTSQLLRADKVIAQDFPYLSSRIFREYDTRTLLDEKSRLERKSSLGFIASTILGATALFLSALLYIIYRKKRQITKQYRILEQKILNKKEGGPDVDDVKPQVVDKLGIEQHIVDDILRKLSDFEDKLEFLESGVTVIRLAARFDTNQNYLSQVVNDYKAANFNRYLSELRIAYITEKLYNDKKYLQYKIGTLAEECGIASRTNFSNLFQEINGIRPIDFIKKRLEDLKGGTEN